MKIDIKQIECSEKLGTVVTFDSVIGEGYAKWNTDRQPNVGWLFDVEFDIGMNISKKHVVDSLPDRDKRFFIENNSLRVYGILEDMDEDGMGYLRFHPSSLMMIQCAEPYPALGDVVCLLLSKGELMVTPFGGASKL